MFQLMALSFANIIVLMVDGWICDEGQEKRPYKTLIRCNFSHHKPHMKYSHIEACPLRWEAGK